MQVPGVKHVVEISSGLAVVGEKYWQVAKARDLISIDWEKGINKNVSSKDIQVQYKKALAEDGGKEVHSVGDLNEALSAAKSDEILDVEYDLPYLAHTCMEPMNAAAQVSKERADIWSPNQAPTLIRNAAADFLQLPRDRVFVHTTKYLGGGFGRRSTLDYSMEAVELAQKINNPVKIIWSREDDTRHSPMRPINRHRFRGLIKEGKAIAWEHRLACESIMQGAMPKWVPLMLPGWIPSVLREGIGSTTDAVFKGFDLNLVTAEGTHLDYSIPNVRVSLRNIDLNIPIHFWRSVGHSYNGFVVESFIDELAHKAKKDPYAFRKDLLTQNPRASGVLNEVARISNWQQPLPAGRARGIAYHFSFQSYVAEVAEVEIKDAQVQVKKVYCAVDCGVAVNPDIVVDQMKSGIIYGLSAALSGEITLNEGGVQQSNFHDYPVLRMSETPDIEVSIVSSDNAPTGVGEPGLPPIAAAVGNAIFSLTGKRLRSLPFKL
jgi:isoquinoline 1-oxidoreductase/isoquinoline 1-oxidoreductase beta subunit